MAEQLFIKILNMSLTGSFVILAVLAMRILLKKAPRIFSYCLWAVVLFRLLCPISFSAAFSPLNALSTPTVEHGMIEYIPQEVIQPTQPVPSQGNFTSLSIQPDEKSIPNLKPITKPTVSTLQIAAVIWLCGILLMAFYSILMLINLKQRLKNAAWEKDNIYTTQTISTPFVIGMIKPRIYLPSSLENYEREYVLLHEQIHIKRFDHIVKIIAFVTLCIHWFNPFVWIAFFLSGKDMEMSCDEAVIRKIGSRMKKEYSASLLSMATGRRIISGVPLAFGEGDTGSRIKNVLRYKKPAVFVINVTAIVCIVTTIVLLANPYKASNAENSCPSQVYYGVVTETAFDNTTHKILMIPGLGEMEIPNAESISTYFEREEQELLPGDLVEITFPEGEEVSIQETWPGRFSTSAESIIVKWGGFSLQHTNGDSYQLTFPTGAFPELSDIKAGDKLSFYREEPEELAFAAGSPESETSRLIATAPILATGENEYGGPTLTMELPSTQIQEIFSGFGLYIRFFLESENENLDGMQAVTPTEQLNGEMTDEGTYRFIVRSVSRSARVIDSFVVEYDSPYDGMTDLAFAEDCIFKANYSMSGVDYREISFDTFADFINEKWINHPCLLTFKDGLVTEARLESAYINYGISFSDFLSWNLSDNLYQYLLEDEGEAAFDKYYSLASSETLDIADCEGNELIEVYTGNLGDGDSGIVMFKDAQGRLLFTQDAHIARVSWNNIYIGEMQGTAFIMNVCIEDRWDAGYYGYWVYRLDAEGGIKQIAGSEFNFTLPEADYTVKYDDALFKEWAEGMTVWLENSHLILSTQEGEVRTEKVSEADKYNYDTLTLKDRKL